MSDYGLCVAAGCDRPAETASYLCGGHRRRLTRHITELPAWHTELATRLTPTTSGGGDPVDRKGHDPNTALRFDVAELRSHIVGVLASWCRLVAEDRDLTGPTRVEPHTLAVWLTRHVPWLARQPFAAEAAEEILAAHRRARAICHPRTRRGFTLPQACPECGEALTARIDEDDQLLPASVECDTGHVWEPRRWLALGRAVTREAA